MNNIHGARINQDELAPRGSGYVGDRAPDFLLANDTWSQILYLTYGPDGQVYMIDWYDRNQCHHGNVAGHDRSNGRIFKVSYQPAEGGKAAQPKAVDLRKLGRSQPGRSATGKQRLVRAARASLAGRAGRGGQDRYGRPTGARRDGRLAPRRNAPACADCGPCMRSAPMMPPCRCERSRMRVLTCAAGPSNWLASRTPLPRL